MNAFHALLWGAVMSLYLTGCASVPDSGPAKPAPAGAQKPAAAAQADPGLVERLKGSYETGLKKIDQGAVSEGIFQLVSVLAEIESLKNSAMEIRGIGEQTEAELGAIRSALALDAGLEWLDANKNQISASTLDIGTPAALNPSVILTLNIGTGKVLVSGAPVLFEFVKGNGLAASIVTTNEYGQANCSLSRLENPNAENIVKASLIYRVKGYTYRFSGIEKEFLYIPPSRKATILVLEKAATDVSADPVILDKVFNRLKAVAFDFSQYNGVLLGEEFMRVFGGDPAAIKKLALEKGVSYLVLVLNDCYLVKQLELEGKKYNIFKSQTTATTRIIRVSDGKILYSGSVQGVTGQGGSLDKAVIDGYRQAAEAMSAKLSEDLPQIKNAFFAAAH